MLIPRGKILLVDDDDLLRHSLQAIFIYTGYEVAVACSGEEALQYASGHPFDVLVTDYRMDGMDGLRLYRELKKRGSSFSAVMISGFSDEAIIEEAHREGVESIFSKPLNLGLLEDTIAAAVYRHRESQES
ncbi:MAG: response regulator [Bacteroidota bacterium]